jgi:Zn-dependent peptidase ImmA (M78 family)/transcriptional regulator with XRE-family HTH domain
MSKVAKFIQTLSLTPDQIASRSGLDAARVQAIRNGSAATLEELRALARGLRLPIRAFAGELREAPEVSVLFRQEAGARTDLGLEAMSEYVAAALTVLPKRNILAEWIRDLQGQSQTYADAENLALRFRNEFVGGSPDPLFELPMILEQAGGVVQGRLETSRFEGASLVVNGYAFVFVSPRFSGRMLFTLAHELGHLLAHHREDRSVVFDLASQIGNVRHGSKKELFVDAFASNLLMPADGVALALEEIRQNLKVKADAIGDIEILYLALFYGVSFEVAARRCEQLELLPDGGAYSLSDHVKKTYGNAEKLAKRLSLPSRQPIYFPQISKNLMQAAIDKIESGDVSLGWVTDKFGCSAAEIYSAKSLREQVRGNIH